MTDPLLPQAPAGEPLDVLVLINALRTGEQIIIHGILADRHLHRDQVLHAITTAGLTPDRVRREWTGWLADRGAGAKRQGVLRAARLLDVTESTATDAWELGRRKPDQPTPPAPQPSTLDTPVREL
ncbi:hypothetical protein [Phytomonospora endophytica]|uniref:Uncharacterized protein n=1 Tax=Phytomonospora endophytica TaxID=714109 RepID=A0A841FQL3_9ACTN|nr:hypothetical protein [Phytomonospora endophytica]MBB6039581.1 hypothetical protein [Phytomonospora endophytica]GIG70547.1 hypothetical protein Pen01_68420 [Phytomonospora endophytica]